MSKLFPSMRYNGVSLDDYIKVLDIDIPPTSNITNVTKSIANRGLSFKRQKRGSKTIKVKVYIEEDIDETIDSLNLIFASYPAKVFFEILPDRYYLVTLSKFGTPSRRDHDATLTLEFESFDGVAHSTTYKRFDNPTVGTKELTFDIDNKGNEVAYPIIKIKSNSENGYIGLVNQTAAMEIGNREETDGKVVEKSVTQIDYRDSNILTGFGKALKNQAGSNDTERLTGTLDTLSVWGRWHIWLWKFDQTLVNSSGSLTWPVEGGSLYDYIWWRQIFWAGAAHQQGFIKIIATDADGQFLYGAETIKRRNGLDCEYNFLVADGNGGYKFADRMSFRCTDKNSENPFNEPRGWSDILRSDDKIEFFWWGSRLSFTVPEIKGKATANLHVILGGFFAKDLITHMYLDGFLYTKNKVKAYEDIPNRFPTGSTIEVNSENKTVIVNGLLKNDEVVDGSDFLKLPPGRSQLKVYLSSWVTEKPTVSVEFEERWS